MLCNFIITKQNKKKHTKFCLSKFCSIYKQINKLKIKTRKEQSVEWRNTLEYAET